MLYIYNEKSIPFPLQCVLGAYWTENRSQRPEVRSLMTEGRGQRTEDRYQRTEGRGQRAEDRSQRTEARGQNSEGRRQRTEVISILVLIKFKKHDAQES